MRCLSFVSLLLVALATAAEEPVPVPAQPSAAAPAPPPSLAAPAPPPSRNLRGLGGDEPTCTRELGPPTSAPPTQPMSTVGMGCQLDFTFDQTNSRRTTSGDIDALVAQTKLFYTGQLAKAMPGYLIEFEMADIGLPPIVNRLNFQLRFFARVCIAAANEDGTVNDQWTMDDLDAFMTGLDYDNDYRVNYATQSLPLESNVFYYTQSVTFHPAPRVQKSIWGNLYNQGAYQEDKNGKFHKGEAPNKRGNGDRYQPH